MKILGVTSQVVPDIALPSQEEQTTLIQEQETTERILEHRG